MISRNRSPSIRQEGRRQSLYLPMTSQHSRVSSFNHRKKMLGFPIRRKSMAPTRKSLQARLLLFPLQRQIKKPKAPNHRRPHLRSTKVPQYRRLLLHPYSLRKNRHLPRPVRPKLQRRLPNIGFRLEVFQKKGLRTSSAMSSSIEI